MAEKMTKEQLQRVMPKAFKDKVTDGMVDKLNGLFTDPALRENYRENLLSYTTVMNSGKYNIYDYLNAVRYVSYKLLGSTNIEAWSKTFPERWQRLVDEGADNKTISAYCAGYNKTKLVNKIMEQTLVPSHVLNADLYQEAINKQASIMRNEDASFKVQSEAANSLLVHLKQPEVAKMELDVNVKQDSAVDDLRATIQELGNTQKKLIKSGAMSVKQVANSSLLINQDIEDAEIVDGQ